MTEENDTDQAKDEKLDDRSNDIDTDDSEEEEEEDLDNEDSDEEDDWDSDYDEDDDAGLDNDETANKNDEEANNTQITDDDVTKTKQENNNSVVSSNQNEESEKPLTPVVNVSSEKKIAILDVGTVEGLPVELTFETSRKQVSLGELMSVTEGYIFVSQDPVSNPIEIRANGRMIGHGRLVNVEGNIGVQITELI